MIGPHLSLFPGRSYCARFNDNLMDTEDAHTLGNVLSSLESTEEALVSILDIAGSTALALAACDIESVNKQRDSFLKKLLVIKTGFSVGLEGLKELRDERASAAAGTTSGPK